MTDNFNKLETLSPGCAWSKLISTLKTRSLNISAEKSQAADEELLIRVAISSSGNDRIASFDYRLDYKGRQLHQWGTCPDIHEELWNFKISNADLVCEIITPLFRIFARDKYLYSEEFAKAFEFVVKRFSFIQKISLPSGGRFKSFNGFHDDGNAHSSQCAIDVALDPEKMNTAIPLIDEDYAKATSTKGLKTFKYDIPALSFRFDGHSSKFHVFRQYGLSRTEPDGQRSLYKGFSSGTLIRFAFTESTLYVWARSQIFEDSIPAEFSLQNLVVDIALFQNMDTVKYIDIYPDYAGQVPSRGLRLSAETTRKDIIGIILEYDADYKALLEEVKSKATAEV